MACPLAFGEVGVKERVKKVMNYRKPAFWVIMAAIACIVVAVCFLTNPTDDTFNIRIVIPAGGEEEFYYSDEEISPTGKTITLSFGEGLGDTEVVLKPMYVIEENDCESTYLAPGKPVRMDAVKGAWFKIGVAVSNPTDEDMIVYVRAKGVTVRIADSAEVKVEDLEETQPSQPPFDELPSIGGLESSSDDQEIENPAEVIAGLLDDICNPATLTDPDMGLSSNPGDYILAHPTEYQELIYYGEYTLRYCFKRFENGDETGLCGKIMAHVCEEILQTEDMLPVNAGTAATGQSWYDTLRAHAGNMVEPYLD